MKHQFTDKDGSLEIPLDYNQMPAIAYGMFLRERGALRTYLGTIMEFLGAILLIIKAFQMLPEVIHQD